MKVEGVVGLCSWRGVRAVALRCHLSLEPSAGEEQDPSGGGGGKRLSGWRLGLGDGVEGYVGRGTWVG